MSPHIAEALPTEPPRGEARFGDPIRRPWGTHRLFTQVSPGQQSGPSGLLAGLPRHGSLRPLTEHTSQSLIAECSKAGDVRDDVSAGELATYCFHALTAAGNLPSKTAVRRLVEVTLAGLRRAR